MVSIVMAGPRVQRPRGRLRSVSPLLTGVLFAAGDLALPFFSGAAFQGTYLALYHWSFRQVDRGTGDHWGA
jgi:hypothetical protein